MSTLFLWKTHAKKNIFNDDEPMFLFGIKHYT